jgi:hypothetical protein
MTTKFPNLKTPFLNREHVDDAEVLAAVDALRAHVAEAPLPDAGDDFAAKTVLAALDEVLRRKHPPSGPSPLSYLVGATLDHLKRHSRAAA